MPSANGVYSLPPGYLAVTGSTILASQHNPPLEDIAAALTLRLSRDGTAAMTGPLQLASGTVTLPGMVFSTDQTAGFYKTAAGIGVAIGGVQVAEFVAGGVKGARYLGELVTYTGLTAPPLCVLPQGQTLSRTTFAELWAFAQTQIAGGNNWYNNGNGSATFGIGDTRGRVPIGHDPGNVTGRMNNNTGAGGINGAIMGGTGGEQSHQLTVTELPVHTPAGAVASTSVSSVSGGVFGGTNQTTGLIPGGANIYVVGNGPIAVSTTTTSTFTGSPIGGNGFHNVTQPGIVCQYALYTGVPS